jgi:integrase
MALTDEDRAEITPEEDGQSRRRTSRWFAEEEEAEDFAESVRSKLSRFTRTTAAEAIDGYEQHLSDKGTIGYGETIRRLRAFFPLDITIGRITPERAKGYYEKFRARLRPDGEPISVAYHRAALINARSFLNWCIEQGWLEFNPLAKVKGIGKRNAGKTQLTIDETRRLYAYCFAKADAGDASALGVLMALTMALRSADLCRRVVRDLDHDGTVLRVSGAKSKASNRPRAITAELQPMVARLVAGRPPGEALFKTPYTTSGHHTHRWLQQAMVRFCEAAGVPYVCPHALKGIAGTIQAELGDTSDRIAAHLSHEETATTMAHYVKPAAVEEAQLERALKVMQGGKK